jgi:hypothetical protein
MTESHEGAVTHPSGWWKASDGNWYPPDQQPGATKTESPDLAIASVVAAVALFLAFVFPWTQGNGEVTLLLCGTAAAFATRWWVFGRPTELAN